MDKPKTELLRQVYLTKENASSELNHIRKISLLAHGGYSTVFKAFYKNEPVVIKEMYSDYAHREIKYLQQLSTTPGVIHLKTFFSYSNLDRKSTV